ncbi:MAG: ACT domain-containing protein [Blastocatellia bacterium]
MSINLYLPETRYAVASLPLEHYGEAVACLREVEGFVSLTRDKEEITLIVAEETWHKLAPRFPGAVMQGGRRLIRFDTVLDFSVVGFIAEISRALAEADISILSSSTYRTDAVLVHESRFDDAVNAIKQALVTLKFTHLAQH